MRFVFALYLFVSLSLLSSRQVVAEGDDVYADGYEYEYVYVDEIEGEVDVMGNVVTDTGGIAAEAAAAQAAAAQAAAAQAAAAAEKQRKEQELEIQRRNRGKYGYKKSVGGVVKRDLPQLRNKKLVDITAVDIDCEPLGKWGMRLEVEDTGVQAPIEEESVVANARKKAISEAAAVLGVDDTEEDASEVTKADKGRRTKPKKPTFRELQAKKQEERAAKEALKRKQAGGYRVGTSCESLICMSCRAVVQEFGQAVVDGGKDDKYQYIEDLLTAFCQRKSVQMRYLPLVSQTCMKIAGSKGDYKDALLHPFEEDPDWQAANEAQKLLHHSKQICTSVGACDNSDFDIQMVAKTREQEHWDDKCYTCQAFAKELEARVHITKGLTEGAVRSVVEKTCDSIDFPTRSFRELCKPLTKAPLLDDISWIAFMHAESIVRKARNEKLFADSLCETVGFCTKWVDPDAEEPVEVTEDMFF